MNNQEIDIELFDNYLEGNLSKEERINFDLRLLSDDSFNTSFNEYKTDIALINSSHDQFILNEINTAEKQYFLKRKRILLGAILGVLIIGLLLYKISRHLIDSTTETEIAKDLEYEAPTFITQKTNSPDSSAFVIPIPKKEEKPLLLRETQKPNNLEQINAPVEEATPIHYQAINRFNKTIISRKSDLITIQSAERINTITPFSKNNIEYLLVNRRLFILKDNVYTYTTDNRPSELIHKSTGLGKKLTIQINYLDITKKEVLSSSNTLFILDSDTLSVDQFIDQSIKFSKSLQLTTRYFTPMDLMYD